MKTDETRRRQVEADARAAWPHLGRAAGLPEGGQRLDVIRTRSQRAATRTVLTVTGPGHGGLVLKHAPDESAARFDSQMAVHQRAEAAFEGVEGLGVPRLLAADRARRAWLMERVPGLTVQDAMQLADGAGRLALLEQAGRWLGHLHRSGEIQFGRHKPGPLLKQVTLWEAALADGTMPVLDQTRFRALMAHTRALAEASRGVKVTRTVVHGDANLRNLIVEGGQVWGIDMGAARLRPPPVDLARLLVWHETFFGPVDGDPVDTPEAARAALLAGHGGRWRDSSALAPYLAVELLRLWRSVPVSFMARGMLHHRRWAGVQRMAARLLG